MIPINAPQFVSNILCYEGNWPTQAALENTDLAKKDDEALLKLLQSGSSTQREDAFKAVYNKYYLDVAKVLNSKGLPEETVKDIFSHVWFVFVNKLPTFVWKDKPFKYFLLSTARTLSQEYFRRTQESSSVRLDEDLHQSALAYLDTYSEQPSQLTPKPTTEVQEKADELFESYISSLSSSTQKEILYRFYYLEQNSTEIAKAMGKKSVAIRVAHHRALKKLRKHLEKLA